MFSFSQSCAKVLSVSGRCLQKNCYHFNSFVRLSSTVKVEHVEHGEESTREYRPKTASNCAYNVGRTWVRNANGTHVKDTFYANNADPDTFGTCDPVKSVHDGEFDEGDMDEKDFLENAPSVLQKLTSTQYAKIIKKHLRNKNLQEAINVLQERMLKEDRVKPEAYIYNLLISGCAQMGHTKQAFQLYNQMKKRGLKVTGRTYTSLFNACATSFYPQNALKQTNYLRQIMIEKKYQPNEINYHAMIKAYGRCGDLPSAFSLVDEMIERKWAVCTDTINSLLYACISNKEAGFRHALLVWRKMRELSLKPSHHTYDLILRACKDCGLGDTHLMPLTELLHHITASSMEVFITENLKQISDAQLSKVNLFLSPNGNDKTEINKQDNFELNHPTDYEDQNTGELLPHGGSSMVADTSTNEHVSSLCHQSSVQSYWPNLLAVQPHLGCLTSTSELKFAKDRLMLFGGYVEFLKQMQEDEVDPNIKTFSQLLYLIPSTLTAEQDLMKAMTQHSINPDINFYNILIKKRALEGNHNGSREVLSLIALKKLKPDIITYGVLALNCSTEEEALELLSQISQAGFRVNAEILGALLKNASWHFNFGYIMKMMDIAKSEEVELNPMFYKHLDFFDRKCHQMIHDKELGRPVPKFVDTVYFKSSFKKFSAHYKRWCQDSERVSRFKEN